MPYASRVIVVEVWVFGTLNHILDRPVWNALSARQRRQSIAKPHAVRLLPQFGDFGAAYGYRSDQPANGLLAVSLTGRDIACVEVDTVMPPPGLTIVAHSPGLQMIMPEPTEASSAPEFTALGEADAHEMAALVAATKPGPFGPESYRLGRFIGLRRGGNLVAMAGERLMPQGFTELASICTRQEYRGRGYAAALVRQLASEIQARGETPFLHVSAGNAAARALYRTVGFVERREMMLTVLAHTPDGPA